MQERPSFTGDAQARNAAMAARLASESAAPFLEGGYVLRVAEIHGRRSGRIISVPIAVFQLHGKLYLTSPTRERPWVRNLLANGACTLVAGGMRMAYRAVLVSDDEATPVLRDYTAQLGWTASQFPFTPGASDEAIRAVAHKAAVFRLDPA